MKTLTFVFIFFLSITSCSTTIDQNQILQSWKGRSVTELDLHPFFSKVPLKEKVIKDNQEKRIYEERGKYQSKARCQTLGGCPGLPSETCQNIFFIQEGVIKKYEMKESCLINKEKKPTHL